MPTQDHPVPASPWQREAFTRDCARKLPPLSSYARSHIETNSERQRKSGAFPLLFEFRSEEQPPGVHKKSASCMNLGSIRTTFSCTRQDSTRESL